MICKMDKHVLIACVQMCFFFQFQYGYIADKQECVRTLRIKVFYMLSATPFVSPDFESFSAVSCYVGNSNFPVALSIVLIDIFYVLHIVNPLGGLPLISDRVISVLSHLNF